MFSFHFDVHDILRFDRRERCVSITEYAASMMPIHRTIHVFQDQFLPPGPFVLCPDSVKYAYLFMDAFERLVTFWSKVRIAPPFHVQFYPSVLVRNDAIICKAESEDAS